MKWEERGRKDSVLYCETFAIKHTVAIKLLLSRPPNPSIYNSPIYTVPP